ncbi:hypothetical protein [Anaerophilus nitritogenes]|uniref:hypothetical protein n=1 Tax=Anaerophilus nitritogenes TaxID=2498136 RepID=UPI00101D7F3F|nr:hypothetical protein [Anaerophilus nitritogenes]
MELKRGILAKYNGNNTTNHPYIMRLIKLEELEKVVSFQNFVYDLLTDKQILYIVSYEDMIEDMKLGAKIIGIFNKEDELIAYRHISFPGLSDRNLGKDIQLPENELVKVAQLERTLVHPDYRGNNLQRITFQGAIPLLKELGYRHLLTTISPFNLFSLLNTMQNGLKIKALKQKYQTGKDTNDGLWRFILHKDLESIIDIDYTQSVTVPLEDLETQQNLINDGFIGVELFTQSKSVKYIK